MSSKVALLAEGVDRNKMRYLPRHSFTGSPSSRRAWIEMIMLEAEAYYRNVALLAEGVDRNR